MANSDADILSKLEEGSDGFVSMPIRLKKSGEPYKNSPVMSTQDFHYMGAYARKKAAEFQGMSVEEVLEKIREEGE